MQSPYSWIFSWEALDEVPSSAGGIRSNLSCSWWNICKERVELKSKAQEDVGLIDWRVHLSALCSIPVTLSYSNVPEHFLYCYVWAYTSAKFSNLFELEKRPLPAVLRILWNTTKQWLILKWMKDGNLLSEVWASSPKPRPYSTVTLGQASEITQHRIYFYLPWRDFAPTIYPPTNFLNQTYIKPSSRLTPRMPLAWLSVHTFEVKSPLK